MPLPIIPAPPIPQVPNVPGVPPMAGLSGIVSAGTLLTSDAISVLQLFQPSKWGIFDASNANMFPNAVVLAVDYRREYRVSDYPLENGAFTSYNKVQVPFDVRVTLGISGSTFLTSAVSGGLFGQLVTGVDAAISTRADALNTLESAAESLDLVSVVTPEYIFPSCNIVHHDYRRESRYGVTLIKIDIWLIEIRVTATQQFTNTQNPASQATQAGGTGQPAVPTATQTPPALPS